MSEERTIPFTITYNKKHLLAPLLQLLTEMSNIAFVGLSGIKNLDSTPDMLSMNNSFLHFLPYSYKMPITDSKSHFEKWIVKKGLEDIVKGIMLSLVEFCRVVDKFDKLNSTKPSSPAELHDIIYSSSKKIDSKNIHQLFEMIEVHLSDKLLYKDQIISINQVRNCLVHRNGIVTYKDIHKPLTSLQLNYSRFKVTAVTTNNKREELKEFVAIDLSQPVNVEILPVQIEYQEGDTVELSFATFNEIIMTAHFFGQDLLQKFDIIVPEKPTPSPPSAH